MCFNIVRVRGVAHRDVALQIGIVVCREIIRGVHAEPCWEATPNVVHPYILRDAKARPARA